MEIFEIRYIREYIGTDFEHFKEKEKLYQVIAPDEYSACTKIGQLYPDDDFTIHIVGVSKIRTSG